MYLSVSLFWSSKTISLTAFVDSGAIGGNYISRSFAQSQDIPCSPSSSIPIVDFTGSPSSASSSSTDFIKLHVGPHHSEMISFIVLDDCRHSLILGYDWLFKHNPSTDWVKPSLTFSRCFCNGLPSSTPIFGSPLSLTPPPSPLQSRPPTPVAIKSLPNEEFYDDSDDEADDSDTISLLIPAPYRNFADVFSEKSANIIPSHRQFDCAIDFTDPKAVPPHLPIYSLSPLETKALDSYLDSELTKGFIRPSKSPAAAPIFFVPKKSGELRPCVNYTALNALTVKHRGPLPLIRDILTRLSSARCFSKIDLRGAYNLVRMRPGDEWKTAFRCHRGHFEYLVMPFGLTNAPAIFQAMMIFSDILDVFVVVYLDDILIFSPSLDDHRHHVANVLSRLRSHNLFAKLSKCSFDQDNVEFLGHSISPFGISPLPEKVSAVTAWPKPSSVKDVQQFVGFTNYYRSFIPDYSALATPLTDLTKKNTPFHWSKDCENAFQKLKSSITSGPVLRHPDPSLPFTVESDASDFAMGAVLSQPSVDNPEILHPVAFFSRKLETAERNYDVHDKELIAIICALEHWRHFLVGSPFLISVLCDHRNLIFFQSRRILKPRHARWVNRLSPFKYSLLYRPGSLNAAADALSRRSDFAPSEGEGGTFNTSQNSFVVLPQALFINSLSPVPSSITPRTPITSSDMKLEILRCRHDAPAAGHPGRSRTFELIARDYVWDNMRQEIYDYVDRCDTCQRNKSPRHKPFGLLQPLPVPPRPWSSLSMDFIVKLPKSKGFDSIFVVVCRLTKQAHFIPCKESMSSSDLADLYINNIFKLHGLPDDIVSDRGPVFRSKFWLSLLEALNIKSKLSTTFHPQTDGQTERVNQSIEQYLRCYINFSQDDWCRLLPHAEFAYNNTMSSTTKVSPFFANLGFHPRMEYCFPPNLNTPAVHDHLKTLQDLFPVLKNELKHAQDRMKHYADNHRQDHSFKVSDSVWLLNRNIRSLRPSVKLDHKRLGPFKIVKQINSVTFELDLPPSYRIHNAFHVSLLEPVSEEFLKNQIPPPTPVAIAATEEYYVNKLLDIKYIDGSPFYLVNWYGFSDADNTWEPIECLTGCDELLQEFHALRDPVNLAVHSTHLSPPSS